MELRTDPEREFQDEDEPSTGIYVRAKRSDGRWGNADIAELDLASLTEWLRSRGGDNRYAEMHIEILLGHHRYAHLDGDSLLKLDKATLLEHLRSRGGDNPWAEDCVGILLGRGHLHDHGHPS